MFMASKYEDIYPLLMKTVFSKIGHKKFAVKDMLAREMDILRVLGFKVSSSPTSYEFATSYLEQVLGFSHKEKEFVTKMTIYLAKMSIHH